MKLDVVTSLFDGISCGQYSLKSLDFEVGEYYACEIKKEAIDVTMSNFPNTIQLGDVRKVDFKTRIGGGVTC